MKYIVNKSNDPAYNIALEEYCFKNLTNEPEIFILWINEPTIVIGKNQNAVEEINTEYVKKHNIHVCRRVSGGGAVYHDLNNLNYTIITTKAEDGAFDFKNFSRPVVTVLKELGLNAQATGRNDIEIDGKKICGTAQAYYNGRMMHHGCILFNVDLSVLSKALKVSKDKIESKGVKSVRKRVTNIYDLLEEKITIDQFADRILEQIKKENPDFTEYKLSDKELSIIQRNRDSKHANWDWVFGTAPDYSIRRDTKYPTGKLTVYVEAERSKIKDIKIFGDFFGVNDVHEVEQALIGCKYTYEDILETLKKIDISKYFLGMDYEDVAKAICNV